jgi:hypothetical protein
MKNLQALLTPLLASGLPRICDAGGRTIAIRRALTEKGPVAPIRFDPDSGAVVTCPTTGDLTFYAAYQRTV